MSPCDREQVRLLIDELKEPQPERAPVKAYISKDSDRYQQWLEVFGSDAVEVLSSEPVIAISPDGPDRFYMLDVATLTPAQRGRLIRFLSRRWKMLAEAVALLIDDPEHGVPIRAEDVMIAGEMRLFA